MRSASLALSFLALSTVITQAQTQRPAAMSHGYAGGSYAGGSSVAYGQPLYYVPRLGPSRYYPPNRYGYVEVIGRAPAPGSAVRTGR